MGTNSVWILIWTLSWPWRSACPCKRSARVRRLLLHPPMLLRQQLLRVRFPVKKTCPDSSALCQQFNESIHSSCGRLRGVPLWQGDCTERQPQSNSAGRAVCCQARALSCLQMVQQRMERPLPPQLIKQCPWTRMTCCSRLWQCQCRSVPEPHHARSPSPVVVAANRLVPPACLAFSISRAPHLHFLVAQMAEREARMHSSAVPLTCC